MRNPFLHRGHKTRYYRGYYWLYSVRVPRHTEKQFQEAVVPRLLLLEDKIIVLQEAPQFSRDTFNSD